MENSRSKSNPPGEATPHARRPASADGTSQTSSASAVPDHGVALPTGLPRVGTGVVILATFAFAALLGGLFLLGYLPHAKRQKEVNADAAAVRDARPVVVVTFPTRQTDSPDLVLPGEVQAFQRTSIYPRISGYLKRQLVDIGDQVEAGSVLAEIDAPEIDAQLSQARANVQNMQANIDKTKSDLSIAKLTLDRYEDVANTSGVTQQQIDEKKAQYNQAQAGIDSAHATLKSAQAEVQRLESLQGFEKIVAPFKGTITARNYDVGALFSSTTSSGGKELFEIEQTDPLRVFVNVPQGYATTVKQGQSADLIVRNYPGRSFEGKVVRSAGAIDPNTRTLRFEVDVQNHEKLLFAGMYGQVRFRLDPSNPPLVIPVSALVYNADGLSVATIRDNKVHFKPVSVDRDLGNELEIAVGLSGDEWIVSNPGEHLVEGIEVQVASVPTHHGPKLAESDKHR